MLIPLDERSHVSDRRSKRDSRRSNVHSDGMDSALCTHVSKSFSEFRFRPRFLFHVRDLAGCLELSDYRSELKTLVTRVLALLVESHDSVLFGTRGFLHRLNLLIRVLAANTNVWREWIYTTRM